MILPDDIQWLRYCSYLDDLGPNDAPVSYSDWQKETNCVNKQETNLYRDYCARCRGLNVLPLDMEEWRKQGMFEDDRYFAYCEEERRADRKPCDHCDYLMRGAARGNCNKYLNKGFEELITELEKVILSQKTTEQDNLRLQDEVLSLREQLAHEKELSATVQRLVNVKYTPANQRLYPHYFRPVPESVTHIDVSWVLKAWDVPCCEGHAIKKLLCSGQRGAKSKLQDLNEALNSIKRAIELEEHSDSAWQG